MADPTQLPLVYALPGMDRARVRADLPYAATPGGELLLDVYLPPAGAAPPDALLPAVISVHGEGPPEVLRDAKDWGQYRSWGRLAAASGLAGVTFNHRSSHWSSRLGEVADDIAAAIGFVAERGPELGIDPSRLGLWVCSGGTPAALAVALRGSTPPLRCLAAFYGRMDLAPLRDEIEPPPDEAGLAAFSPIRLLDRPWPPLLIARAGRDQLPHVNETIDRFVAAAVGAGLELELLNHAAGQHGFDVRDDLPRSREIIALTLGFLRFHLAGPPAP